MKENPIDRLNPNKIKIDTSQFHDLMHRPFTSECRELPGGSWKHLKLWWEFRGSMMLAEMTRCKVGRHQPVKVWRRGWTSPEIRCQNCLKLLKEREKEE